MSTFKEHFNILYEKSKLSQKEFGINFNASADQVFNWRNGRGEPDIETLKKIAATNHVSIAWLIGAHEDTDNELSLLPLELKEEAKNYIEYLKLKNEQVK